MRMHLGRTSETASNFLRNFLFSKAFIKTKNIGDFSSKTVRKIDLDSVFYDFELLTAPLPDNSSAQFGNKTQHTESEEGDEKL